jgi:hypothetical protein
MSTSADHDWTVNWNCKRNSITLCQGCSLMSIHTMQTKSCQKKLQFITIPSQNHWIDKYFLHNLGSLSTGYSLRIIKESVYIIRFNSNLHDDKKAGLYWRELCPYIPHASSVRTFVTGIHVIWFLTSIIVGSNSQPLPHDPVLPVRAGAFLLYSPIFSVSLLVSQCEHLVWQVLYATTTFFSNSTRRKLNQKQKLLWLPLSYLLLSSQPVMIVFVFRISLFRDGARGSVVVKALFYKPEGRGFDSRWGKFLNLPKSFRSH